MVRNRLAALAYRHGHLRTSLRLLCDSINQSLFRPRLLLNPPLQANARKDKLLLTYTNSIASVWTGVSTTVQSRMNHKSVPDEPSTNMDHSQKEPRNSDGSQDGSRQGSDSATARANSPANESDNDSDSKPQVPMQKRRRVTRACDECRRKKIKCDGKQPCTHCTVYSYGKSSDSTPLRLLTCRCRLHIRSTLKQKAKSSASIYRSA